jgi:hypothetical protein
LSIFQEKQSYQILITEIHKFLSGEARMIAMLLFTEVIFEHKLMHGSIQPYSLVGITNKLVFFLEYLHKLSRQSLPLVLFLIIIAFFLVGVLAHLQK